LADPREEVSVGVAYAVARLGDVRGRAALDRFLIDPSETKRRLTVAHISRNRGRIDQELLGCYSGWIDPLEPIQEARVASLANGWSGLNEEEVRERFRRMQEEFHLTLDF
jgi:hypothetical protein